MRVKNHPILGETEAMKTVTFYFNGVPVEGAEGEPIAAAPSAPPPPRSGRSTPCRG